MLQHEQAPQPRVSSEVGNANDRWLAGSGVHLEAKLADTYILHTRVPACDQGRCGRPCGIGIHKEASLRIKVTVGKGSTLPAFTLRHLEARIVAVEDEQRRTVDALHTTRRRLSRCVIIHTCTNPHAVL